MSPSSSVLVDGPAPADGPERLREAAQTRRPTRRAPSSRFVRSELRLLFGRRRNQALLVVLALIPVVIGLAVRAANSEPAPGEGPEFLSSVSENGLFLVFTSLVVTLPLFLVLAVGVVSGDAVAGEANTGTLRYLLATPVQRTRLLVIKYAAVAAFGVVAVSVVALAGLATGLALFPRGDVTLLDGSTISLAAAIGRAALVVLYVSAGLLGIAAIGLFVSTLTEVPVAAMAATIVIGVTLQILDAVPQISWLHPWLASHYWLAFGDLLRNPVRWSQLGLGLRLQAGYLLVFGLLAWARFTTKDVTS